MASRYYMGHAAMKELDPLYLELLQAGLLLLRSAACDGNLEWCKVEAEHLHNVPSLIGEENMERHFYYMKNERLRYVQWVQSASQSTTTTEAIARYILIWKRMADVLTAWAENKTGRDSIGR